MTYDIFQTCLLVPTELNPSECASWVQAIGSILAIGVAVWLAMFQAAKQQEITRNTILEQSNSARLSMAETLAEVSKASFNLQKHFQEKLIDKSAVHEAKTYGMDADMSILRGLEQYIYAIEIHKLPEPLVKLGLSLAANIGQLRVTLEKLLSVPRQLRDDEFTEFIESLRSMGISLSETVSKFEIEIHKIRNPK